MLNNVTLVGRLTKEAEVRYTTSNKAVANFTLAVNRNYKNQNGEYETDFINCEIWGNVAEIMKKFYIKGELIGLKGVLRVDSYEKDGKKKYKTFVLAERITLLSRKSKQEVANEQVSEQVDPFKQFGEKIENDLPVDDIPW